MSLIAANGKSFPCIASKKMPAHGHFLGVGKFLVSVKELRKHRATDCKTVYPGSIPGVASKSLATKLRTFSRTNGPASAAARSRAA